MYIELFILDNLLMDFIILRLAAAMLSVGAGIKRTTLFALIGSALAALGAGGMSFLLSPVSKLALSVLMSFALPGRGARKRLFAFLAVFVSAAAVGGAVMLLALMLGGEMRFGAVYSGLSLRTALIGGVFASFLPNIIRRVLSRRVEEDRTVRLGIVLKTGEAIECAALVDSGNMLLEPLSALPVIVLSAKKYASAAKTAHIPIPARTAAGACTLFALKPKSVTVNGAPAAALIAFSKANTALVPSCLIVNFHKNTNRSIENNAEAVTKTDRKAV